MNTIELIESGVDEVAELTDEQAAALQAAKIMSVAPLAPGRWLLRGTGKVGVVRIGDLTVRIRPKLPIRRVFFLLGYGRRFAWRDVSGSGSNRFAASRRAIGWSVPAPACAKSCNSSKK